MLEAARENIPELLHYVFSCYSSPSSLFFHGTTLQSAEGVQQGDPLGPLLFCLTIHPLITSLKLEYRVFYLDDGTIGGPKEEVLQDLQYIECQAAHLGLSLNHSKTELICEDSGGRQLLQAVPDLCKVKPENATLLGAPHWTAEFHQFSNFGPVAGPKDHGFQAVPFPQAGCASAAQAVLCHP